MVSGCAVDPSVVFSQGLCRPLGLVLRLQHGDFAGRGVGFCWALRARGQRRCSQGRRDAPIPSSIRVRLRTWCFPPSWTDVQTHPNPMPPAPDHGDLLARRTVPFRISNIADDNCLRLNQGFCGSRGDNTGGDDSLVIFRPDRWPRLRVSTGPRRHVPLIMRAVPGRRGPRISSLRRPAWQGFNCANL